MQTIVNLGTGGADLNGQNGSTTSADSNDALFLDWPGDNAGNYVYLPGVTGNYLSVPDEAALDIAGDIDIRFEAAAEDWSPASVKGLVAKWTTSGNFSYLLRLETTGALRFFWSADGSTIVNATSTATLSAASDERLWVRVTLDVDNGASGYDVTFFTSTDGGSWSQLGSVVTGAGVTSIFNTSVAAEIGSYVAGGAAFVGKLYRAQVFDGIDGTKVLDVDTSAISSGSDTSFSALTGQTVTINRSTSGRKSVAVVSRVWLFGTDDYIEVAANPLLGADTTQDFSVVLICREWDTPVSNTVYLSNTFPGGSPRPPGFHFQHRLDTYKSFTYWQDGVSTSTTELDASLVNASGDLSVMGFNVNRTTNQLQAFTNNGVDTSGTDIGGIGSTVTANAFRIGRGGTTLTAYSNMEVLGVVVFRRVLTSAEITAINTYYQNKAA